MLVLVWAHGTRYPQSNNDQRPTPHPAPRPMPMPSAALVPAPAPGPRPRAPPPSTLLAALLLLLAALRAPTATASVHVLDDTVPREKAKMPKLKPP